MGRRGLTVTTKETCDAVLRRYKRTGLLQARDEFLRLRKEAMKFPERERTSFIRTKIFDTLDSEPNFWSVMCNLDLLPKPTGNLVGFSLDVLTNTLRVCLSPLL